MDKKLFFLYTLTVIILTILTACYSLPPVSPQSEQRVPIVAIVNNTGFDCYEIYVKPASDQSWGSDLLGSEILPNGETFRIRLTIPLGIADIYDIKIVDIDDDIYTKYRLQFANGANVVFTKRDASDY